MKHKLSESDLEYIGINQWFMKRDNRKPITQATERRVNEILDAGGFCSGLVREIWDGVRRGDRIYRNHLEGTGCRTSIKRLKDLGEELDAGGVQVDISHANEEALRLSLLTRSEHGELFFRYVSGPGLSHVVIKDLNELIKAITRIRDEREEARLNVLRSLNEMNEELNGLFDELVPAEGPAESVAGEIARAACRIGYRHLNDGDKIGERSGVETCHPAAGYLMETCGEWAGEILEAMYWTIDDAEYRNLLSELIESVVGYVRENPGLRTQANDQDSFKHSDPFEEEEDEEDWSLE